MGLIAREIEARGIPTLSFSSAYSITAAVNPPRAVYLDYPLGHTTGRPNAPEEQMSIMQQALQIFAATDQPGAITTLPFEWREDDSWKDNVMRPKAAPAESVSTATQAHSKSHKDDRVERFDSPQYQSAEDAAAADPACPTCIFLEPQA